MDKKKSIYLSTTTPHLGLFFKPTNQDLSPESRKKKRQSPLIVFKESNLSSISQLKYLYNTQHIMTFIHHRCDGYRPRHRYIYSSLYNRQLNSVYLPNRIYCNSINHIVSVRQYPV